MPKTDIKIKCRKRRILKIILSLLSLLLLLLALAMYLFGVFDLLFTDTSVDRNMTRRDIESSLVDLRHSLKEDEDNLKLKTKVAYYYYFLGDFETAESIVEEVISKKPKFFNPYNLLAELYYVKGKYKEAEALMSDQLVKHPYNLNVIVKAQSRLMLVYYQTNKFELVKEFRILKMFGAGGFLNWMNSFNGTPNRIDWGDFEETRVKLISLDPLPILKVNINGEPIYAFIDTGADCFMLDSTKAEKLGISSTGNIEGSFAGGLKKKIGFSQADTLTLGDLTIENASVSLLSLDEISESFKTKNGGSLPKDFKIEGIVGTKLFQHVLGTLDYKNKELVLKKKNQKSSEKFKDTLASKEYVKVPFYLADLHTITAKGTLLKREVMYYLDSGLGSKASLMMGEQTLEDFEIEKPQIKFNEEAIGGGGKGYEEGYIEDIGEAGISDFIRKSNCVNYIPDSDDYWSSGFIKEAILSHSYLRDFAWTLDFDEMTMYLVK